jgi:hypothetical protein
MRKFVNPGLPDELLDILDNPERERYMSIYELAADLTGAIETLATGDQIVVTVDREVRAVLVGVEYYEALVAALGLQMAFREMQQGAKLIPHEEVVESLRKLQEIGAGK